MNDSNLNKMEVPLTDILSNYFFETHTKFKNLNDFFIKAGYEINSRTDIDDIPQEKIDLFVKNNTKFNNFSSLQMEATLEYIARKFKE